MFSTSIIEKLAYYIYCLIDPRDGNIFYVGKGVGNRVFHHAQASLQETEKPSDKIALIREIHKSGNQPVYYILRHNIQTDEQAFEYEAMAIDLLSLVKPSQQPLTNIQGGTHSSKVGLMDFSELKRQYDAQELKTDKPIVLITINKEYEKLKKDIRSGNIPEADRDKEIYERTRKYWKIGSRREKAKYAVAVYRGWTLAVYEIERWISTDDIIKGRWMFEGKPLPKESDIYQEIVDKLTYSSQENYKAPQYPITYRNC